MNLNKYSFNFTFHTIPGTKTVALYCQGIPYTCGNYTPTPNGFKYKSYIFQDGHGTPTKENGSDINLTEIEMKEYLIVKAVDLIIQFHNDKPIKVANGHII